jgi:ribulose 1,5-bisphosphate synthetase/thiazole synthase
MNSAASTIIGLDAPEELVAKSEKEASSVDEVDYVVIGSGIGGLSAAALLSYYGYSVVVLESHYLPVSTSTSAANCSMCSYKLY